MEISVYTGISPCRGELCSPVICSTMNIAVYFAGRRDAVPYNWLFEMFCIKFVPTSEMRVSLRTEECAERTWEREQGAASRCYLTKRYTVYPA